MMKCQVQLRRGREFRGQKREERKERRSEHLRERERERGDGSMYLYRSYKIP